METYCQAGDIAVIIQDVPGCECNIGCLVLVRGPVQLEPQTQMLHWLITPLSGKPYYYRDFSGDIIRMQPDDFDIEHPDAWMRPLTSVNADVQECVEEDQSAEREKTLADLQ